MKTVNNLREKLLEDVEGVIDLDQIASDGRNRRYLVYLPALKDPSNPDKPLFLGTDYIHLNSFNKNQALIENILMRINPELTVSEAKIQATINKYDLVIEDLETGLIYDYQYCIIN